MEENSRVGSEPQDRLEFGQALLHRWSGERAALSCGKDANVQRRCFFGGGVARKSLNEHRRVRYCSVHKLDSTSVPMTRSQ